MTLKMEIVTISSRTPTESYFFFDSFIKSCNRFGFDPIVLGRNHGEYQGLGTKPTILKRAIDNGTIKSKWMIFTDSWDVVFQSDPNEIPKKEKIVFNAEKHCFPERKLAAHHPPCQSPFRYLNSGFAVGPTEMFHQALTEMGADENKPDKQRPDGSWETPNDQEMWQHQYLFGNTPITLDTRCQIAQTLSDVSVGELDFTGEKIRNFEMDSTPFCFHANGRKEEWKPIILGHLKL